MIKEKGTSWARNSLRRLARELVVMIDRESLPITEHGYWLAKDNSYHHCEDPFIREQIDLVWLLFGEWDEDNRGSMDGAACWYDDEYLYGGVVVQNQFIPVVPLEFLGDPG